MKRINDIKFSSLEEKMKFYIYNGETRKIEETATPWWHSGVWADAEKAHKESKEARDNEPLFGKSFED